MTDWITIPLSEIAANVADIETETFLKLTSRGDFLKEVIDGTNAWKIPGQALEQQAAGSGTGITADRFNHQNATGTLTFTATATETQYANTGITATQNRIPKLSFSAGTVVDGEFRLYLVLRPNLGTTWWVRGDMTTGVSGGTVTWRLLTEARI